MFVRSNWKVVLTESGILFHRCVDEILDLEEKIKSEFGGKKEKLSETIGMAESISANIVAQTIQRFRQKFSSVQFELFTAMADQVQDRIDR